MTAPVLVVSWPLTSGAEKDKSRPSEHSTRRDAILAPRRMRLRSRTTEELRKAGEGHFISGDVGLQRVFDDRARSKGRVHRVAEAGWISSLMNYISIFETL